MLQQPAVTLSGEECMTLETFVYRGKANARTLTRARILLKSADGWSTPMAMTDFLVRLLALKAVELGFVASISPDTIHELLKKTGVIAGSMNTGASLQLEARRVAAMEDVLDLYEEEYDPRYPTVCLDEKPVVLHADVHPPVPFEPGQPERVDYEYKRSGTRNLFVLVEPLAGWRHVEVTAQRTMQDYAQIVRWLVDEAYPHCVGYVRRVTHNEIADAVG